MVVTMSAKAPRSPGPTTLDSTLERLLAAFGPPGREAGVRAVLRKLLRGAGQIDEDATGNLHVRREGSGRRLLLAAHMDAPGVIVTRLEGDTGQARITMLGVRKPAEVVGASIRFERDRTGVVSWERKDGSEPEADQLLLETGLGKRARTEFDVGDVGVIDDRPARLGELWGAANLDNRAGCAALVQALTRARGTRYDVHAVFTAQSDLGARGATTGAFGVEPEIAVVIDVAHLGEPKETSGFALGKGPCVALKEQGFLAHPEMLELVRQAARSARIPLQYAIREGEGSDARAVRAARTGVPTAVFAIPARRSGGIWSLVHARDMEQTAALIGAILKTGGPATRASRAIRAARATTAKSKNRQGGRR
jgi:endoglucanase